MVSFRKTCAALFLGAVLPALARDYIVQVKPNLSNEEINKQVEGILGAGKKVPEKDIMRGSNFLAYAVALEDEKDVAEFRKNKEVLTLLFPAFPARPFSLINPRPV